MKGIENMTVKQFLENKYREKMLNITEREWKRVKEGSEYLKMHPTEIIYMSFEITEYDIKNNGGWYGELHNDLLKMHEQKLVASNKHKQESGHIDRYWLTKKGLKSLKLV
jgi:hypothetical protein